MADPVIPTARISCGDQHFDLAGLMASEMVQVKAWTQLKNRQEFYRALQDEDPDALLAAFSLVKWRQTGQKPRWGEVDANIDDIRWSRHVDGREVELDVEKDANGEPLIAVVDERSEPIPGELGVGYKEPTGEAGEKLGLVIRKDEDGNLRWTFKDTGEDVRPTGQPATNGSTGSPSTATTLERSASDSGTPTTGAA